jgi:hypothetical protein
MTTMRTVLNNVLRVLREDEVDSGTTSLTIDYQKLVATFLNHIKEEVEDAHQWRDLQTPHTATVAALSNTGLITGANERSRLVRVNTEEGLLPVVFDVTDAANPFQLFERPLAQMRYWIAQDTNPGTTQYPGDFCVEGNANGTLDIVVYPKPTTQRTYSVLMITPQTRLADNDLDTVIKIPTRPIEMGTIWYALEERGEEMGQSALFTEERYRKAVDDAVARDADEQGGPELQIV